MNRFWSFPMKLRSYLAAATFLALPLAAHAQPVTGPYVSLEGGLSILSPVNYSETLIGSSGKVQYRSSYAGIGAVGYGFGNGWRVELNGDYLHNTVHEDDSGITGGTATGRHNIYGPSVDVLYDFNAGLPVFPYLGIGGGYQWIQTDSYAPFAYGGTKMAPDFNVVGGLSYPLAQVPGLSLTAEYRFTQVVGNTKHVETVTGGFPAGADTSGTVTFNDQTDSSFLVGVRYQLFNAPPAAPAPAPAPAPVAAPAPTPARTYLVFFDWDKSNLTPRATQIIAEAASDSKTTATTTLDVSGYTDTSGTPVYNQGLSERRAKSVAAQLVTDGVPASEIEIHAYGETHLLVPTGPGVREPQNRRVEIVLN